MIFCLAISASAQTSCQEKLANSQKMFDKGDFVNSLDSLSKLRNNNVCKFSKKEKEMMLELIARNLIELDQISKLDSIFIQIFENNVNYNPSNELIEEDFFLHLSNHSANSKMDISFGFGGRTTFIEKIRSYSLNANIDNLNSIYESKPEASMSLTLGYKPFNRHKLNFDFGLQRMSNKRIDKEFGVPEIRFEEKIKSISFGINYGYEFRLNDNTSLNSFVGYEINIFTRHEATYEDTRSDIIHFYTNSYVWSATHAGTRINFGNYLNFGFNLSYRVEKVSLFLNSGYQYGFENFVVDRYTNHDLVYEKNFVADDYILHFLTIQVGLKLNFKYKIL
jgi:hypothetical protein